MKVSLIVFMLNQFSSNLEYISDRVLLVDLQGKLKSSRKQPAELIFDYNIESIGRYLDLLRRY